MWRIMSGLSISPGRGWRRSAERSLALEMMEPLDSNLKCLRPGMGGMMVR